NRGDFPRRLTTRYCVKTGTEEYAASLYFLGASLSGTHGKLLHGMTGRRQKKLRNGYKWSVNVLPTARLVAINIAHGVGRQARDHWANH
ncbi:MAG: hypothetical protein ACON37_01140, partial [Candidatus Puniceispirillaceae bacterium]